MKFELKLKFFWFFKKKVYLSINFQKLALSKKMKIYEIRNIFSKEKIVSQGFKYYGIGR